MTSQCSVRLMPGRIVIRMSHDKGTTLTELLHSEAVQVRDMLTRAILALENEEPFPKNLQGFIDAFDPAKSSER